MEFTRSPSPRHPPHMSLQSSTQCPKQRQKASKRVDNGRDVMVWGGNGECHIYQSRSSMTFAVDYQLGNGRRSSLAVPQHLPPLVPNILEALQAGAKETDLSSGTVSGVTWPRTRSRQRLASMQTSSCDRAFCAGARRLDLTADLANAPLPITAATGQVGCVRSRRKAYPTEGTVRRDCRGWVERLGVVQQDHGLIGLSCYHHASSWPPLSRNAAGGALTDILCFPLLLRFLSRASVTASSL